MRDLNELDNVEPPLTSLILGDERLRSPKPLSDLRLCESCLLARCDEQLAELLILGRVDRIAHAGRWKGR
jgi:hypothetical protein